MRRHPAKTNLLREEEANKASLRWFHRKYHPYCEILSKTGMPCMGNADRVLFTMDGCVSCCEDCFSRLGIRERDTRRGVLPPLPKRSTGPTVPVERKETNM